MTTQAEMQQAIKEVCVELAAFLIEKNESYGNSVAEPVNMFAKGLTPEQQIGVRIDDKLSRIASGSEYPGDDTVKDLAGYLILQMALKKANDDA